MDGLGVEERKGSGVFGAMGAIGTRHKRWRLVDLEGLSRCYGYVCVSVEWGRLTLM